MRTERLRKKFDFEVVFKNGSRWRSLLFVILYCNNSFNVVRVGIPIKKSMGNAVKRNRIKRMIRESVRLSAKELTGGIDSIVLPCNQATSADFHEIKREIDKFLEFVQSNGLITRNPVLSN